MNTLHEFARFSLVTLPARRSDIHFRDRRLRVCCRQHIVAVVTISANCRAQVALRNRFRVDAFSIRKNGTIADTASLHHRFVAMTPAARFRDRGTVDGRVWITGGQDGREVAVLCMAIAARCCLRAVLNCLSVEAAFVSGVWTSVKP